MEYTELAWVSKRDDRGSSSITHACIASVCIAYCYPMQCSSLRRTYVVMYSYDVARTQYDFA